MSKKFLDRFEQLLIEAKSILETGFFDTTIRLPDFESFDLENRARYSEWIIKAQNLLYLSCGDESVHYRAFEHQRRCSSDNVKRLRELIPIFSAAYDDLKNGFLITFKQIVQSEVFDSELEQAKSLLDSGYQNAAAVIAGVVLETAVKELCLNNNIEIERKRLTQLNDDLTKASVYNKLQQKQITALADIRNNAAHGNYDQFTKEDVERMIDDIERFLLNHSS